MVRIEEVKRFPIAENCDFVKFGDEKRTLAAYRTTTITEEDEIVYHYEPSMEERAEQALSEHVSRMFRGSPCVQLVMNFGENPERFPNIQNVKETIWMGTKVEAPVIEEFLEKYPNLNGTLIIPPITRRLKDDSKLFSLRYLDCVEIGAKATQIIQKFTGRHLRLRGAKCTDATIRNVLRKWISGESYQNWLTLTVIPKAGTTFSRPNILNGIETTNPDPSMQTYTVDTELSIRKPEVVDCRHLRQIVRVTDSKRALIHIGNIAGFVMFIEN